jgi:hypothetical protein
MLLSALSGGGVPGVVPWRAEPVQDPGQSRRVPAARGLPQPLPELAGEGTLDGRTATGWPPPGNQPETVAARTAC